MTDGCQKFIVERGPVGQTCTIGLSSVFQASYPCGLGMFSKNMYAPLVGSDKGGRANVNRDERVNHTECMKVLAGVPLWEREGKRWRDGGIEQLHVVEDIILNSFTALIRPLK